MIVFNPLPAKFMGFIVGLYALLLGMFVVYIGFLIKNLGKKENEIES
jgi:amino acid permease